ncbi:MAG: GlsB/YeaQ/YmgE family stress response membrane protein [Anaerolineales bacterium]|nr:GlsB/YeaQ/YmgE family stress response membrane protein [Anaerolineales bacterium]
MTLDQLVLWIIVGGIAGLLADAVIKGIKVGLVGAIVVGILGAIIGGWLFGLLNISLGGGFLGDILTAFIGAVILLVLLRALRRL